MYATEALATTQSSQQLRGAIFQSRGQSRCQWSVQREMVVPRLVRLLGRHPALPLPALTRLLHTSLPRTAPQFLDTAEEAVAGIVLLYLLS